MNFSKKLTLKSLWTFFVTCFVFLCFVSSSYAYTAKTCRSAMNINPDHMDRITEIMNDPRLSFLAKLKDGRSASNAIRVYDFIVSRILTLTSDEFNVLYISTPHRFNNEEKGFWMSNSRNEPIDGYWTHHVVLEFNGYIIDPDFDMTKGPVPTKKYFEERFKTHRFNRPELVVNEEIFVYQIKGEDYLHELDYLMDMDLAQRRVLSNAEPQRALTDFLK